MLHRASLGVLFVKEFLQEPVVLVYIYNKNQYRIYIINYIILCLNCYQTMKT